MDVVGERECSELGRSFRTEFGVFQYFRQKERTHHSTAAITRSIARFQGRYRERSIQRRLLAIELLFRGEREFNREAISEKFVSVDFQAVLVQLHSQARTDVLFHNS